MMRLLLRRLAAGLSSLVVLLGLAAVAPVGAAFAASTPHTTSSRSGGPSSHGQIQGTTTVTVHGQQIQVKCTGRPTPHQPTVVLLAGMPDPLGNFDALQRDLSRDLHVCSFDRPGEGGSAAPDHPVTLQDTAHLMRPLLARLARGGPVVLVGHSLGGLVAAKYAHDFPHRVQALVLLDATPPSAVQRILDLIPADAGGIAAAVRGEMSALTTGDNPERLVYDGAPVGSLGDIPLTVVQHGLPIFDIVPDYGAAIQRIWSSGQRQWAALSTRSSLVTAPHSGHYVYLDQPALTERLIRQAAARSGHRWVQP